MVIESHVPLVLSHYVHNYFSYMETTIDHLEEIVAKMEVEQLPELAIRSFVFYYQKLIEGETGLIRDSDIRPVDTLPDLEKLDPSFIDKGEAVLNQTVMIKLNGGLGTGMGLQKAKTLLPVKSGLTFLDVIAKQAIHWNIPLVLMNSFSTAQDSRDLLESYSQLKCDLPLDFLQHKVPKILQSDLSPVSWGDDPALEWCPPGHGDIYTALVTTGLLDQLLDTGKKYVFVSNGDNLGAKLDLALLGYFSSNELPFMMEVADRTPVDRKGGHLALKQEGGFLLRESAQCPPEDQDLFQDITRHKYFNTNNLWLHLGALKSVLEQRDGILELPMIRNSKTVNPRDPSSPSVFQLETAMGAAIETFDSAGAIRVPRSRFAPVKTTSQLLAVQSDAYRLLEDYSIVLDSSRSGVPCVVNLDDAHYKTIDQIEERFPQGPPSLLNCQSLTVQGDVYWGKGVVCEGSVEVSCTSSEPAHIPDRSVLSSVRCILS